MEMKKGLIYTFHIINNERISAWVLIGEDPFCRERIYRKLFRMQRLGGSVPILDEIIGIIDCALWDLAGQYCNLPVYRYNKYYTLTRTARKFLLDQPWYGNLIQLERFCERMILESEVRMINEAFVRQLAGEINRRTPEQLAKKDALETTEYELILAMMEKYHGDRQRIADHMGISKVTLWRKMKQYGILS